MDSADGPELEVDAEHDHARQQEGDAGGGDGVDGAKVQPTRGVFLNEKWKISYYDFKSQT